MVVSAPWQIGYTLDLAIRPRELRIVYYCLSVHGVQFFFTQTRSLGVYNAGVGP